MERSGISKQEQQRNPQAVLDVLDFYTNGAKNDYHWNTPSPGLPLPPSFPQQYQPTAQPGLGNSNRYDNPRPAPPPPKLVAKMPPPPIAPRPQHTMTIYSTDLPDKTRMSTFTVFITLVAINLYDNAQVKPIVKEPDSSQMKIASAEEDLGPAPRRNKTVGKMDTDDFVEKLKAIVNPNDPTRLYRNFVKIGQG